MKNEGSARTALTFALFFDPFQVPIEFVFNPNIKKLLSALEIEYTDPKLLLKTVAGMLAFRSMD